MALILEHTTRHHLTQYQQLDFESIFWNLSNAPSDLCYLERLKPICDSKQIIIGPIRTPNSLILTSNGKNVLLLRDPRDVLISSYYSVRDSHALPARMGKRRSFLMRRARALRVSLDEFVLQEVDSINLDYQKYAAMAARKEFNAILKYEDFTVNPHLLVEEICAAAGVIPDRTHEEELILSLEANKQNLGRHIRGSKERATQTLKSETKEIINEKLRDVLAFFNY